MNKNRQKGEEMSTVVPEMIDGLEVTHTFVGVKASLITNVLFLFSKQLVAITILEGVDAGRSMAVYRNHPDLIKL